jgi:hypothetical protein
VYGSAEERAFLSGRIRVVGDEWQMVRDALTEQVGAGAEDPSYWVCSYS